MSEKFVIHNKKSTKWKRRALKKRETPEEKIMWEILRNRNFMDIKFRRQQGFGEFIVDFYASKYKLVIEIDGNQHYTKSGLKYDKMRTNFIENFGATVLRFRNREVREDIEGVKIKLKEFIEELEIRSSLSDF